MTSAFWLACALIAAEGLYVALRYGCGGPLYQRRGIPFRWPDGAFFLPLLGVCAVWAVHRFPLVAVPSLAAAVALASFLFGALAGLPFAMLWRWLERLPASSADIAASQLGVGSWRRTARCLAWQGLLLLAIHLALPRASMVAGILGAVLLLATAPRLFGLLAATWRYQTSYNGPLRRKGDYDLFVSYKSHDVGAVRAVVDLLLSSGVRAWFAEYTVLLHRRGAFQDAIAEGIRSSRRGLLFTNDRYIGSPHCQDEVERLTASDGPGGANLLEVRIPDEPETHQRYGHALAGTPAVVYHGDPREVAEAALEFLGRSPRRLPSVHDALPPSLHHGTFEGAPYCLDIAGWEPRPLPAAVGGSTGPDLLLLQQQQGRRALLSLVVRLDPSLERPHYAEGSTIDDRRVYDHLTGLASVRLAALGLECRGVHLFFHAGFSHLLLTYWQDPFWVRKYFLVLPHPHTGRDIEFAIECRSSGRFTDYLRSTSVVDRVARSLQWEEES